MNTSIPTKFVRDRSVGIAAVLGCLAAVFLFYTFARGADPRIRDCVGSTSAEIRAAFDMEHASDFWLHFPMALDAPELMTNSPAYVVVLNGPIELGEIVRQPGTGAVKRTIEHLVCVYVDGVANKYPGIDLTGFKP